MPSLYAMEMEANDRLSAELKKLRAVVDALPRCSWGCGDLATRQTAEPDSVWSCDGCSSPLDAFDLPYADALRALAKDPRR